MAGTSQPPPLAGPAPVTQRRAPGSAHGGVPQNRRVKRLTGVDRVVVVLMVTVPLLLTTVLVWLPAIATVLLSFTSWNGIGDFSRIKWIGFKNYHDVVTIYPAFWPAVRHNIIWLVVLFLVATPAGILLAVLIDKGVREPVLPVLPVPAGRALAGADRVHLAAAVLRRLRRAQLGAAGSAHHETAHRLLR